MNKTKNIGKYYSIYNILLIEKKYIAVVIRNVFKLKLKSKIKTKKLKYEKMKPTRKNCIKNLTIIRNQ